MNRTGIQAIIASGVALVESRLESFRDARFAGASSDDDIQATLDRFAQLGAMLIQHDAREIWPDLLRGFQDILRLGKPSSEDLRGVATGEAEFLLGIAKRLFALGGILVRQEKFHLFESLVMLHPNPAHSHYYWSRYTVTMVSRGELEDFKKSLIPPASTFVQGRPELMVYFDGSIDNVVDAMCQFDMLQCVYAVAAAKRVEVCYPNFGGYFNDRTIPIVHKLIASQELRALTGTTDDRVLASILDAIDETASNVFFTVNGWHRGAWEEHATAAFISQNRGPF